MQVSRKLPEGGSSTDTLAVVIMVGIENLPRPLVKVVDAVPTTVHAKQGQERGNKTKVISVVVARIEDIQVAITSLVLVLINKKALN